MLDYSASFPPDVIIGVGVRVSDVMFGARVVDDGKEEVE